MTTPRYTELADLMRRMEAWQHAVEENDSKFIQDGWCLMRDALAALRHAADLEREVAELRGLIDAIETDVRAEARLGPNHRQDDGWHMQLHGFIEDLQRAARDLAGPSTAAVDQTGAETHSSSCGLGPNHEGPCRP